MKKLIAMALSLFFVCQAFFVSSFSFSSKDTVADPRNSLTLTEVKDQIVSGPCWAFASMATLEVCLAKKNVPVKSLSEKHLLNWANQENTGWHIPLTSGLPQNYYADMGYFVSGKGPVCSTQVPYNILNTKYDESKDWTEPLYSIRGIKHVNTDISSIKDAVATYGAVASSYVLSANNGHAVSIIGWNDNNQSWLIKDSGSTPCGYHYLPYSSKFNYCYTFTDIEPYSNNEKIYQHDYYGYTTELNTTLPNLTTANVFDFKEGEALNSIIFESGAENQNYALYYAPVLSNGKPDHNSRTWKKLAQGTVKQNGYNYVELENKLNLTNSKGAIILKLTKADCYNDKKLSVGIELSQENYILKIDSKINVSFILDNTFTDVQNILTLGQKATALCIKAITTPASLAR